MNNINDLDTVIRDFKLSKNRKPKIIAMHLRLFNKVLQQYFIKYRIADVDNGIVQPHYFYHGIQIVRTLDLNEDEFIIA